MQVFFCKKMVVKTSVSYKKIESVLGAPLILIVITAQSEYLKSSVGNYNAENLLVGQHTISAYANFLLGSARSAYMTVSKTYCTPATCMAMLDRLLVGNLGIRASYLKGREANKFNAMSQLSIESCANSPGFLCTASI